MIFLTKSKNKKQRPWLPYLLLNLRPDLLFPGGGGTPPIPDIPPPILPNGPNDVPQPPAPKDLFAVGEFLYQISIYWPVLKLKFDILDPVFSKDEDNTLFTDGDIPTPESLLGGKKNMKF